MGMAQKLQIQTKAPRAPEGTEESMDCKESRPACGLKPGFSNEAYIRLQSEKIRSRIGEFGGKLYMEFGGKLFDVIPVPIVVALITAVVLCRLPRFTCPALLFPQHQAENAQCPRK